MLANLQYLFCLGSGALPEGIKRCPHLVLFSECMLPSLVMHARISHL